MQRLMVDFIGFIVYEKFRNVKYNYLRSTQSIKSMFTSILLFVELTITMQIILQVLKIIICINFSGMY